VQAVAEMQRVNEPSLPDLRDQFAMAAMNGHLANHSLGADPRIVTEWAYRVADAMLEAREK
jgi:hypothetical protein